jgi:hypothetical protein
MRKLLPVLLVLFVGCGPSVKFFPMNEPPDNIPAERIEVMSEAPERPYIEIGLIKVRGRSKLASSPENMMRLLKEKALTVGADAVIISNIGSVAVTAGTVNKDGGFVGTSIKDEITAMAIAWK